MFSWKLKNEKVSDIDRKPTTLTITTKDRE